MNPELEKLIVRQLDGELTPSEEAGLQRELARNETARILAEEYRRIDSRAAEALEGLVSAPTPVWKLQGGRRATVLQKRHARTGRSYSVLWWAMPAAVAAALALIVFMDVPRAGAPGQTRIAQQSIIPPTSGAAGFSPRDPAMPHGPRTGEIADMPEIFRDTDRELIGVIGEDGRTYWLQVDRTRTFRDWDSPAVRLTGGGF